MNRKQWQVYIHIYYFSNKILGGESIGVPLLCFKSVLAGKNTTMLGIQALLLKIRFSGFTIFPHHLELFFQDGKMKYFETVSAIKVRFSVMEIKVMK